MVHAERFQKCISLIFCDLDNFKPINDTFGHAVGDEILKEVASSLKNILRKEDTICRFGGDEFVILVEELESFKYLDSILQRINNLSCNPCLIEGNSISIGMSIGASIYPDDGRDPQTLIKAADSAMYRAKNRIKDSAKSSIEYSKTDLSEYCLHDLTMEVEPIQYNI